MPPTNRTDGGLEQPPGGSGLGGTCGNSVGPGDRDASIDPPVGMTFGIGVGTVPAHG
jgi:hypothetical protein